MAYTRSQLPKAIGELGNRFYKLTGIVLPFLPKTNPGMYVGILVGSAIQFIFDDRNKKTFGDLQMFKEINEIVAQLPKPMPKLFNSVEVREINQFRNR